MNDAFTFYSKKNNNAHKKMRLRIIILKVRADSFKCSTYISEPGKFYSHWQTYMSKNFQNFSLSCTVLCPQFSQLGDQWENHTQGQSTMCRIRKPAE